MVEHRGRVEQHLEDHHRQHGWAEHGDGGELDQHRQRDLDRVETRAGGQVIVQVGVVHLVQPPQRRHGVHHHVLQPDHEVHRNHRQRHGQPERHVEVVEQTPAVGHAESGDACGCERERQPQQHGVEHDQAKVAAPALGLGQGQRTARCSQLPQRHGREDTQEETQPDGRLMGQDELFKIHDGLR